MLARRQSAWYSTGIVSTFFVISGLQMQAYGRAGRLMPTDSTAAAFIYIAISWACCFTAQFLIHRAYLRLSNYIWQFPARPASHLFALALGVLLLPLSFQTLTLIDVYKPNLSGTLLASYSFALIVTTEALRLSGLKLKGG